MNLLHLNEVRKHMVEEIKRDIEAGTIYISDRLNELGRKLYPQILLEVATHSNVEDFVAKLDMGHFNTHESSSKAKSGFSQVPHNANITLCEGEFNRYYIRGVCLKAIEMGKNMVMAYRARHSDHPRSESLALEGKGFSANQLLGDLRENPGVDTALGLPPGPNSGMSVRL